MSNLEELDLCLAIHCENKFLDGYDLKQSIINHLLQLKIFNFHSKIFMIIKLFHMLIISQIVKKVNVKFIHFHSMENISIMLQIIYQM
jgi:hypothetical protein